MVKRPRLNFRDDDPGDDTFYLSADGDGAILTMFADGSGIVVPWDEAYNQLADDGVPGVFTLGPEDCTIQAWRVSDAISFCCLEIDHDVVLL